MAGICGARMDIPNDYAYTSDDQKDAARPGAARQALAKLWGFIARAGIVGANEADPPELMRRLKTLGSLESQKAFYTAGKLGAVIGPKALSAHKSKSPPGRLEVTELLGVAKARGPRYRWYFLRC